jgi:hypothetical protein
MRVIACPLLTSFFIAAIACVSQSVFAQKTGKTSRSDVPLIVETRIVAPKRVGEFAEDNCATAFDLDEYAQLKDKANIVVIEYDAADWTSQ